MGDMPRHASAPSGNPIAPTRADSALGRDPAGDGATLSRLIEQQAERTPDAVAIQSPDRSALTYQRLQAQLSAISSRLAELGVGRADRVAVVLPTGPELAVVLLALASSASCAPLNPSYTATELAQYLDQLRPMAVLTQADLFPEVAELARVRGLRLLELQTTTGDAAGIFNLGGAPAAASPSNRPAEPQDIALAFHTSGTTAHAKIVPLTHANLTSAASNIQAVLRLDEADCCLNIMPLLHIHGFSVLLATLISGGRVVCPPGFYATMFFDWIQRYRPTWYSAAPTMHQAILARAAAHQQIIERCPLRFIRSASSGLPLPVREELERTFRVPVIEAYGMTEAAPQIASNRLPPAARKPGSVGRSAGPEVAILDAAGNPLPATARGEVAVRGANITSGYEGDPAATAAAFHGDWLRTGDEGYLDEDGDLFITGRLKEMINRGGEKIAPREVDEALLAHPAVVEAAAFPVADPLLGEEVGAAVVLRPGQYASEEELRAFVGQRLAYFKAPRRLLIVPALPKGPTAKLRRAEIAERLAPLLDAQRGEQATASTGASTSVAPRTPLERELAAAWSEVLAIESVGIHDDFFALGGDSMLATLVISRIADRTGLEIDLIDLFEAPTIAALVARIETDQAEGAQNETNWTIPANLADL